MSVAFGSLSTETQSQEVIRMCFVDEIPRVAPMVWSELLELVPLYQDAPGLDAWGDWIEFQFLFEPGHEPANHENGQGFTAEFNFMTKLDAWAKKYHLTDTWLKEWAFCAIQGIAEPHNPIMTVLHFGETVDLPNPDPSSYSASTWMKGWHEVPHMEFEQPRAFDPLWDTDGEYLQYIKNYMKLIKKHHLERSDERDGASRHVRVMGSSKPNNAKHFACLVEFQCLGKRWEDFSVDGDESKIRKPATSLSRQMGLSLRGQGKPGRPPK